MNKEMLIRLGYQVQLSSIHVGLNSYHIKKHIAGKTLLYAVYNSNNIIQKITHWVGNDSGDAWKPIDPNIELTDIETIVALYLK